ncbi:glycosyltransferase family 2 protein [Candidatus Woesearchaeota archaeon]|nr:glycosyltransferase family 2 protein [Candidatus Woesearchaeota archaeon]
MILAKDILIMIIYLVSLYFGVFWILFFIDTRKRLIYEKDINYEPKNFVKVIIAIPAYNEEKTIKKTLLSVINLDYPKKLLEIIVINDGSTDKTEQKIFETIKLHKAKNVKYIKNKNQGKAASMNHALRISKAEYFVCLDADSHVEKNALRQAVGFIQQDKELVIVTPIMHVHKPRTIVQKLQKIEYLTAMLLLKLMGYIDSNYIAPGPFSLYKADIIRKLGGFDENNLTEDQEIAYRAQSKHLKIRQCPSMHVYTQAPGTLKALYRQRNRWFKGSLHNFFKYKHLMLNKKYGDFGVFQMPINISAFLLASFSVAFFLYNIIKPIIKEIKRYILLDFDFLYIIRNIEFNFSLLNINVMNYYIILTLLLLAGSMFYASHLIHDRSVKNYGFIVLIPYFFIYYILLSFFAVIVIIESLFGVKQKW